MLDDTRSKSYDPNVNKFKQLLIDKGERVFIRHYWFHPVWPTQSRDVVMVSTWEQLSDDSVLVSTIGLPDYIEPSEGSVRAYVCSSSCYIRPGYSPHRCLIPPAKAGSSMMTLRHLVVKKRWVRESTIGVMSLFARMWTQEEACHPS